MTRTGAPIPGIDVEAAVPGRPPWPARSAIISAVWIWPLAVSLCFGLAGCGATELGAENTRTTAITLRYVNESSDQYAYVVRGLGTDREQDALLSRELFAVPPGRVYELGAGPDPRVDDSGCFVNEQFWALRSRANVDYWRTWQDPPDRDLDDLLVIHHLGPDSCFAPGTIEIALP